MEKSRAIEVLKPLVNSYVDYANITMKEEDDDIVEALELAVDALKEQPTIQLEKAQLSQDGTTSDLISRQAAIDALDFEIVHMTAYCDGKNEGNPLAQYNKGLEDGKKAIEALPSAQPETAKRIVGKWRDGMTLWYQCDMCNEPVDEQDNYCRGCGRRLIDG